MSEARPKQAEGQQFLSDYQTVNCITPGDRSSPGPASSDAAVPTYSITSIVSALGRSWS